MPLSVSEPRTTRVVCAKKSLQLHRAVQQVCALQVRSSHLRIRAQQDGASPVTWRRGRVSGIGGLPPGGDASSTPAESTPQSLQKLRLLDQSFGSWSKRCACCEPAACDVGGQGYQPHSPAPRCAAPSAPSSAACTLRGRGQGLARQGVIPEHAAAVLAQHAAAGVAADAAAGDAWARAIARQHPVRAALRCRPRCSPRAPPRLHARHNGPEGTTPFCRGRVYVCKLRRHFHLVVSELHAVHGTA